MGAGYCPMCFAMGECGDDCITKVQARHAADAQAALGRERSKRRHFSNALTWIENNAPGGLVLVARALSLTDDRPVSEDDK